MFEELSPKQRDLLEDLVDAVTLSSVMEALSEICGEKAERIRAQYDIADKTARLWATAEGVIGVARCSIPEGI